MFRFDKQRQGEVLVLALHGNLDAMTAGELKTEVVAIAEAKQLEVVVDLGAAHAHRFDRRGRVDLAVQAHPRAGRAGVLRRAHRAAAKRCSACCASTSRSICSPPSTRRSSRWSRPVRRRLMAWLVRDGRRAGRAALPARSAVPGRARPVQPRGARRHPHLAPARRRSRPKPAGHVVYDLNSANGTYVNDVQVKRQKLQAERHRALRAVQLQVRGRRVAPSRTAPPGRKFVEV